MSHLPEYLEHEIHGLSWDFLVNILHILAQSIHNLAERCRVVETDCCQAVSFVPMDLQRPDQTYWERVAMFESRLRRGLC